MFIHKMHVKCLVLLKKTCLNPRILFILGEVMLVNITFRINLPVKYLYHSTLAKSKINSKFVIFNHINTTQMEYADIIQFPDEKEERSKVVRFSLTKEGQRMLIVIGFNPSTADSRKKDPTMGSVLYHAGNNGYDGFVMLNLYPLRSPSPNKLPKEMDITLHSENIHYIKYILDKYPDADILLAYGDLIKKRKYMRQNVQEIQTLLKECSRRALCLYKLKSGNPKHPLRAYGNIQFQPFEL